MSSHESPKISNISYTIQNPGSIKGILCLHRIVINRYRTHSLMTGFLIYRRTKERRKILEILEFRRYITSIQYVGYLFLNNTGPLAESIVSKNIMRGDYCSPIKETEINRKYLLLPDFIVTTCSSVFIYFFTLFLKIPCC